MKHIELLIGLCCLVILGIVLTFVCFPLFEVPVPDFLQKNEYIRRFFAWDSLDNSFSNELNETALRNFLIESRETK